MPGSASSLAPFAQVEESINAGVIGLLANAVASIAGGEPFGVIFDSAQHNALGELGSYSPTCSLPVVSAPGLRQGSRMRIAGRDYEVVSPVESDSSGWATVQLREAFGGAHA